MYFHDGKKVAEKKNNNSLFYYLSFNFYTGWAPILESMREFHPFNLCFNSSWGLVNNHKPVWWVLCDKPPGIPICYSLNVSPLWTTPQSEVHQKNGNICSINEEHLLPCVLHWSKHLFSCSCKGGRNFLRYYIIINIRKTKW